MEDAIRVEGLTKLYGSFTAVDDVSFHVKSGEIFGIVGPNGAGKTTTLEIIEGLQKPNQGRVSVLGLDALRQPAQIKARIGVQLQSSAYYDYLNLREILFLLGSFYPKRIAPDLLLERVGLLKQATQKVKHLSGGQKQRFTVAASLVNDPELVILDEPTTGLDPQSRRNLWELIREIHQRGVTVVLTTHYLEEAEALCQRLAIMDRARLVAVDTPQNLISRLETTYTVKLVDPMHEDMTMDVGITAGKETTIRQRMKPLNVPKRDKLGELETDNWGNSAIYLNGKYYANSNELDHPSCSLLLDPGEYDMKLVPVNGSKGREGKVTIKQEQTLVLDKGKADTYRK